MEVDFSNLIESLSKTGETVRSNKLAQFDRTFLNNSMEFKLVAVSNEE